MVENKLLPSPNNSVVLPAHWIGKPMQALRLRTILANLRRVR